MDCPIIYMGEYLYDVDYRDEFTTALEYLLQDLLAAESKPETISKLLQVCKYCFEAFQIVSVMVLTWWAGCLGIDYMWLFTFTFIKGLFANS